MGLAEVLPRRVRNLLGPRSSVASTPAEEGASLDLSLALHCVPTNVPKRATGSSLVATKEKLSLQSRIHIILEEEEDKEEESPSFGRCRPLCRVADSGPKPKVKYPYISALPSLMIYPPMCGHVLEPDSRLGLSVPAGTLPVSGLPRRLRCFLGPRLPLQPPKELWQGSSSPREWPHQVGLTDAKIDLAEVLP